MSRGKDRDLVHVCGPSCPVISDEQHLAGTQNRFGICSLMYFYSFPYLPSTSSIYPSMSTLPADVPFLSLSVSVVPVVSGIRVLLWLYLPPLQLVIGEAANASSHTINEYAVHVHNMCRHIQCMLLRHTPSILSYVLLSNAHTRVFGHM